MPNGPATDSLEIKHKPGTVPGGARPGWGLPFQQLPAATRRDLTPESTLDEQFKAGRQQIQNKYALQWKEVNRSKRFIGTGKAQRMLREIDAKAKQEMLQFNQQAQQQMTQLQDINRLAEQGMITNPDEIKARMVYGTDVARSMYPREEKERTIPQQFGELDVYSHRISQELENFQMIEERIPKLFERKGGIVGWPLPKEKRKRVLYKMDYSLPSGKKDKFGDPIMGKLRKADEQEIQTYDFWRGIEKQITAEKRRLAGMPGISRRIVQPGTTGGTFSDKITESVKPQRQQPAAKPKIIRQRNRNTGQVRESRDGGRTWQIISG